MSYFSPTALADALDILSRGPGKIIAGGTDVYPSARPGESPDYFLDLTRVDALSAIRQNAAGTYFGATVTWTDIVRADLHPAFDALKAAGREVGSVQIQNAGTLAGNLCNASPAADGVPALLALEAVVEIASAARGARDVPLADFITGVRQTALAPDELVRGIRVPPQPEGMQSAFEKLGSRTYLVISICMTAANVLLDARGRIAEARVAVGACSAVAQRLAGLEKRLIGMRPADLRVTPEDLEDLSPIDDVRGTASYRLDAVQEQIQRTLQRASAA
ncbi:Xanthine dehydrogenase, FAD binding subunit [Candidatus Rhodobacter oscarellae]|uniref:Xanthine dehydrogenase, FAD binding subunit n=1 Tax=Candidatus Rhodobacter oscarellae TaxID=1675527 RepID=A0A0J9EBI3_9RHOB|nr:FAD binding domain-containing protein [Candidatus Rhodobacter lobularis]KMW60107.1 Xanthine dehydrogenase, FAD binding subunit [Candidatus Rhodobacter lobularis]